jgi:hypothetical protein
MITLTVCTAHLKLIPSSVAPSVAYSLYESYGGQECLELIDWKVICGLMEKLDNKELICFVPVEYDTKAVLAFEPLKIAELIFQNVWDVLQSILPLMVS